MEPKIISRFPWTKHVPESEGVYFMYAPSDEDNYPMIDTVICSVDKISETSSVTVLDSDYWDTWYPRSTLVKHLEKGNWPSCLWAWVGKIP